MTARAFLTRGTLGPFKLALENWSQPSYRNMNSGTTMPGQWQLVYESRGDYHPFNIVQSAIRAGVMQELEKLGVTPIRAGEKPFKNIWLNKEDGELLCSMFEAVNSLGGTP